MKKIYLLSAVACMFALNVNAEDAIGDQGWFTSGGGTSKETAEQVSGSILKITVADKGDPWSVQLCNHLVGFKGQSDGSAFKLEFEVAFAPAAAATDDSISIQVLTGKFEGLAGYTPTTEASHQWDGTNSEVKDAEGNGQYYPSYNVATDNTFKKVVFEGTIGELGAQDIGLQINFGNTDGKTVGTFYVKNVAVSMKGKVVLESFKEAADNTAIAEEAAVKAYVANNVIFASEAVDVVVYNINGVAVKSAKNVTSLNVADLKAGLYIAKVGNTTVKFVK